MEQAKKTVGKQAVGKHMGAKEAEKVNIASIVPVDAPYFTAGSVSIQGTGNDFLLTFSRPSPVQSVVTGEMHHGIAINKPVAILSISPQTAKDIALTITEAVAKHEKEYGEIITPHTKRQAASVGHKKGH